MSRPTSPSFASLVQEFFTDYMTRQRSLSPQTIASYRDSFVLLLRFTEQTMGKPATAVELSDLQPKFIAGFLDHLERERGNSPRSRNIRLAALRSFLKFAAHRDVANLNVIEQALSVPMKRFDRKIVGFLTREQMLAVIHVPSASWLGQRDHLLLTMMFNTGARVSEIIGLRVADVVLGQVSCVRLHGKGRKQRSLPLWKATAREVRDWLRLNPHLEAGSALLSRRPRPRTLNWASWRCRLTWFATRPRWVCCKRAQLPPISLCGSDTRVHQRLTCTSRPTLR